LELARMTIALLWVATLATAAHGQDCQPDWLPGEGIPGVDGVVNDITTWDADGDGPELPRTVIAGRFQLLGSSAMAHIAIWNGTSWQPIAGEVVMQNETAGEVRALAVYKDDLIVGG